MPIFLIRIKIFNFGLLDPKEYLKLTKTWSKSKTFVSVSSLMAKNHRKQSRECGMPFVLFTAASLILQLIYLKVLKTINNYADFTEKNDTHTYPACIFSRKKHRCLTIYLCLHVQRSKRDHHLRESLDMLVHAEWLPWHTPLGKDDLIIKMNSKD